MTQIRKKRGRVIHAALSYIFQVLQVGGSPIQKYDSLTMSYVPNRAITPFILRPQLLISDPDGEIPSGEYSSRLANVTWEVYSTKNGTTTYVAIGAANGLIYNASDKSLQIEYNVEVGEILKVTFSADYVDTRRNEVQHFKWSYDLTTEAQAMTNVSLDSGQFTSKLNLLPWKHWGQFGIPVQLRDGAENIPDASCSYQWQYYDETNQIWKNDLANQLWYVSGAASKQIIVNQDYIQDVVLRVKACAYGDTDHPQYFVTRLRRWYGQYDEEVDILTGDYIYPDSTLVVLEAKVTGPKGLIENPAQYFDIELFFGVGNEELQSVGYGTQAVVRRSDLQNGEPQAGILCRELTCFMPIEDVIGALTDGDGELLVAQFPTTTKE